MDGKLGLRFALVAILAVVVMVQFAEAGYYGYGMVFPEVSDT